MSCQRRVVVLDEGLSKVLNRGLEEEGLDWSLGLIGREYLIAPLFVFLFELY